MQETTFDVVVIDEAAQALEVACWIALLKVGLGFGMLQCVKMPSTTLRLFGLENVSRVGSVF